jgi:hypothetical protein
VVRSALSLAVKRRGRMSGLALVTLGLAACTSTGHWNDPGVHAVVGYWVGPETGCAMGPGDACTLEIAEAKQLLSPGDLPAVTGVVMAEVPREWVRADGTIPEVAIFSGLTNQDFVIFDLRTGQRRAFLVLCNYQESDSCRQWDASDWRVGTAPSWADVGLPTPYSPAPSK